MSTPALTPTRILLVTGGSRGIGAATAVLAARAGWDVAINYTRDATAAEAVAAVLRRPPEQVAWMFDEGPRAIADGLAVRPPRLVPQPREARQS